MLAPAPAEFRSVGVVLWVARFPRGDAIIRSYFYRFVWVTRFSPRRGYSAACKQRKSVVASIWSRNPAGNIRGLVSLPLRAKYADTGERLWYEHIICRRTGPRLEMEPCRRDLWDSKWCWGLQCRSLGFGMTPGRASGSKWYCVHWPDLTCKIHILELGRRMSQYEVAMQCNTRGYPLQHDLSVVIGRRFPCGIRDRLYLRKLSVQWVCS